MFTRDEAYLIEDVLSEYLNATSDDMAHVLYAADMRSSDYEIVWVVYENSQIKDCLQLDAEQFYELLDDNPDIEELFEKSFLESLGFYDWKAV